MTKTATEQLEIRLENLENKVAFQDDTIEQLNQEITSLNLQNTLLKRQIELLALKVKENKLLTSSKNTMSQSINNAHPLKFIKCGTKNLVNVNSVDASLSTSLQ